MPSPTSPLLTLYLAEFAFGMLYALLIHWAAVRGYARGSTAWSVIAGTAGTLLIQWIFMPEAHVLVTFGCFASSGLPMTLSYLYRYEEQKASHKARPLGNRAKALRDEALMDLSKIEHDIAENDIEPKKVLYRISQVKRTLRSMSK